MIHTFRNVGDGDNVAGGEIEDLRKLETHLVLCEWLLCTEVKDRRQRDATRFGVGGD